MSEIPNDFKKNMTNKLYRITTKHPHTYTDRITQNGSGKNFVAYQISNTNGANIPSRTVKYTQSEKGKKEEDEEEEEEKSYTKVSYILTDTKIEKTIDLQTFTSEFIGCPIHMVLCAYVL